MLQLIHFVSFRTSIAVYGYGKDGRVPARAYIRPAELSNGVCVNWIRKD